MPNYKNLKTYSKTQKVVNYSTLFDKEPEPYMFNSSSSSEATTENNDPAPQEDTTGESKPVKAASKRGRKKKVDKENEAPKQATSTSTGSGKKAALPEPEVSEVVYDKSEAEPKTTGRRKAARVDYNPAGTKRTEARAIKLFQSLSNTEASSSQSQSSQNITSGCGTTQDAPKHSTVLNDTCAEIDAKLKAVEIEPKTTSTRGAKKAATAKLKASSSASNLKTAKSGSRGSKAAALAAETKENNLAKVETKKGGIKKSKSTSNVLTVKKAQLMNMNENKEELVKEVGPVKSIIKSKTEESGKENGIPSKKTTTTASSKKAVKILEKIDDKNDQLTKLKLDNRIKHAAQTSTPSGLRRKPLKLPTDISMIVTPNKEAPKS